MRKESCGKKSQSRNVLSSKRGRKSLMSAYRIYYHHLSYPHLFNTRVLHVFSKLSFAITKEREILNHLKSSLLFPRCLSSLLFSPLKRKGKRITKVLVSVKFDSTEDRITFLIEWNCYWDIAPFRNLFLLREIKFINRSQ